MNAQLLLNHIAHHVCLTLEEQTQLLEKAKSRRYLKGQFVVQQGDVCEYESFVLSGCLKTFHIDQQGDMHIIMFAIENCWVGDLESLITQSPANYNVQCLENTELVQFSRHDLERLYLEIPKLERFFRIIFQQSFIASEKRIISSLSLCAKDRYQNFRQHYPEIEKRVPQYLIASYLGISKEFLSRIRNDKVRGPDPVIEKDIFSSV